MKLCLAALLRGDALAAALRRASAATMTASTGQAELPQPGEAVTLNGTGFTPEQQGQRRPRRQALDPMLNLEPHGRVRRRAHAAPGHRQGQPHRTRPPTCPIPAVTASTGALLVIAIEVKVRPARPRRGGCGRASAPAASPRARRSTPTSCAPRTDGKRLTTEGPQPADRAPQGPLREAAGPQAAVLEERAAGRLHGAVRHLPALRRETAVRYAFLYAAPVDGLEQRRRRARRLERRGGARGGAPRAPA